MGKKPELYLLQLYNDGTFTVYAWTPIIAKKGYTVMTAEQAEPYILLASKGNNHVDYVEDKDFIKSIKNVTEVSGKNGRKLADVLAVKEETAVDGDESNTESIVNDAVENVKSNKVVNDDEIRELSVSQESIQIKELNYIRSLQHKSTLESHMLEKYQCEIPTGRLDAMKALANSMIGDLAKSNRLYLIDGEVTK